MQYTVAYTGFRPRRLERDGGLATTLTSTGKTLPAMTVTTVTRGKLHRASAACNPTNSITWPVTLSTTAQKIYNAAANTGRAPSC